ncbi:hypothetical protein QNO07_24435 [Streptomyces sp. 549]|uniref:hypothetical protein n=1 Tax=Streptomyces sp. 549 TaxID=3049076 RepID=UPI0024C30449|nr:hypothetical protein [Streptomyces sp. 549]MDK1476513.1 hypothetical protein [Streptomyces sp. 549]
MTEPQRYPSVPVELPYVEARLEPQPVDGCPGCAELAKVREWARASDDQTTITDCNVLLARHPNGH